MASLVKKHLDAANTTFYEQGEGSPVVLVHGSGCDYRVWEAQRENIASHYHYIALNLHYHGTDPWLGDGKDYSVVHHADQVITFLKELGLGPVHLIGQSYGGHVTTRVALQVPYMVRSLVLQEPAIQSLVNGPEAAAIMDERQRAFAPAGAAVGSGDLDLGARMLIEALINKGPGTWDAGPDHLKQMIHENTRTLPLMFAAPPAPPITCQELQHLSMPVLIINGAETMRFYSYIGEQMEKCIPNVQRQVIDSSSHGIETQNPTAYWKFLREFLNEH